MQWCCTLIDVNLMGFDLTKTSIVLTSPFPSKTLQDFSYLIINREGIRFLKIFNLISLTNAKVPTGVQAAIDIDLLPRILGDAGSRQIMCAHTPVDARTGGNFSQLKLTAEKMMQEEASLKSELNVMRTKYLKSEEDVRNLESKVADLNNEIAMLTVEHNEDVKLWKGLDSKFLATSTFSNHLTETLTLLESQLKEAEQNKNSLERKLAEREKFYEDTKSQIDETYNKLKDLEDSITDYEEMIAELGEIIQEQTTTLAAEVANAKVLLCRNDDLEEQVRQAAQKSEEDKKLFDSMTAELQQLTKNLLSKLEDVTSLQNQNLTLMQAKGAVEIQVKDLENSLKLGQKDKDNLREKVDTLNLRISELQKINEEATLTIENLNSERARRAEQVEHEKTETQNTISELADKISEYEKYQGSTRQTLLEKSQEIESLLRRVAERDAEIQTTKDQVIRMQQECSEKQQRIERLTEQEQNIQRQMQEIQENCTGAENAAKELSIRYKHQLEAKQAELTLHLQEISQRNNQEMAEMRRRFEEETKQAAAEEKRKGEAALEVIRQSAMKELSKELDSANERLNCAQKDHEDKFRQLKKAYEEEKEKALEQHAKEIRSKEQELRIETENRCSEVSQTLHQRIEELKKLQHEEIVHLQARHDILLKRAEEADSVKEQIRKLKEDHKAELGRVIKQLNDKFDVLKHEHEADVLLIQSTARKDVEEWRSKAAFWHMECIKLRAITSDKAGATEGNGAEIARTPNNTQDLTFELRMQFPDVEPYTVPDSALLLRVQEVTASLSRLQELQCQKRERVLAASSHSGQREKSGQKVAISIVTTRSQSAKNFITKTESEYRNGQMQSYPARVPESHHPDEIGITRKQSRRSERVEDCPSAGPDSEAMLTVPLRSKPVGTVCTEDCDKMKNVESWLQTSFEKSRRQTKKVKFNVDSQQQSTPYSKTLCDLIEMEELMDPYAFNEG
ncbi:hypothetical protein R1sor_012922 [Riccia sorocarpa]|uniref:Uncharacterized protein n=1 Tax=Riccia sorocarpa TaxID=122646 RepID=A0ABD3I976_9MARC